MDDAIFSPMTSSRFIISIQDPIPYHIDMVLLHLIRESIWRTEINWKRPPFESQFGISIIWDGIYMRKCYDPGYKDVQNSRFPFMLRNDTIHVCFKFLGKLDQNYMTVYLQRERCVKGVNYRVKRGREQAQSIPTKDMAHAIHWSNSSSNFSLIWTLQGPRRVILFYFILLELQ